MNSDRSLNVKFQGHVQGVGFRYTVQHYARKFAVSGYVRNCVDGAVELVAEGSEEELKDFLKAILNSPLKKHIHNHLESWSDGHDLYTGFKIAY